MTSRARLFVRIGGRSLASVLVAALLLAPGSALAATAVRERGAERVSTSGRIGLTAYPQGAGTVVLARSHDYPDALAAATLGGVLEAPIVLSHSETLYAATAASLTSLRAQRIVVVGGTAAISEAITTELDEDYEVERLAGDDRYGTAAAIARAVVERGEIGEDAQGRPTVLIASGQGYADALTSAPAAYSGRFPVVLVLPEAIPAVTAALLDELQGEGVSHAVILGGTTAVGTPVEAELTSRGLAVDRIGGQTRTETASLFGAYSVQQLGQQPTEILVTRGDNFPDALAGGALGGVLGVPVVLTESPTTLGKAATDYLESQCAGVETVRVLGGVRAVTDAVSEAAEQAATCG
jgi:putative cell wall-binding protein